MVKHLTAKEYATATGLSSRTVRRRLANGELAGVQAPDPTTGTPTWYVVVADETVLANGELVSPAMGRAVADPPTDTVTKPGTEPTVPWSVHQDTLARLDRFHRENLELAGRCGWLQAELEQARQTIKQLQAPISVNGEQIDGYPVSANDSQKDDHPPAETVSATTPAPNGHDSGSERPPRPWWRRWVAWLAEPV